MFHTFEVLYQQLLVAKSRENLTLPGEFDSVFDYAPITESTPPPPPPIK